VCLAALLWLETLEGTGVEGIVAKPLPSSYKAGRVWAKVRHADTVDATVVGFTGTVRHPKALAVRLDDGRVALSQRLTTALASVIGPRLPPRPRRAFTKAGDSYTPAVCNVVVGRDGHDLTRHRHRGPPALSRRQVHGGRRFCL
jgi:hypothetical protein